MEHITFMQEALKEANKAYKLKEVPVGAIIVKDGEIIGRGYNKKEILKNPLSHAELIAIDQACKNLNSWRLTNCSLYVTLEPCAMCAGAILQSRIDNVFIATKDFKTGALGSVIDLSNIKEFNHKVFINYGLLRDEASTLLKKFFKELRSKKKWRDDREVEGARLESV